MMAKILAILVTGSALLVIVPTAIVQGAIALRTDYRANCETDAWMSQDFRLWADELRRAS